MTTKIAGHTEEVGQLEGEICGRSGCAGVVAERPVDGCACHINPPCPACTAPREYCPECGWEAVEDEVPFNDFLVRPANPNTAWSSYRIRPLDPKKIDWHSKSHTHFSMIKEGVMPPGSTKEQVLERIGRGTFGGRFEYFRDGDGERPGTFKYIAYTD